MINECDQLKSSEEKNFISIATADSFLAYNLAPFYRELVFGKERFNLEIKLQPADMIYSLISKKEVDIAIAWGSTRKTSRSAATSSFPYRHRICKYTQYMSLL